MNRYGRNQILWMISFVFTMGLIGCDKDYLLFDTSQKAGLYSTGLDSVRRLSKSTEDTVRVNCYFLTLGIAMDYDRDIALEVVETNMAAGKYGFKTHVMKAGEVRATVQVIFYKDPSMVGKKEYIVFRVLDNEYFRVIPEMTRKQFYISNEIQAVKEPAWWKESYLGPFSLPLYAKMVSVFMSLKESEPSLYAVMSESLGEKLEFEPTDWIMDDWEFVEVYDGEMWSKYKYPMMKNVIYPLFFYYQENPEEGVNVPEPNFYE